MKIKKLVDGYEEQYTLDLAVEINGINQNSILKTVGVLIGSNGMFTKNINTNLLKVNSQIQTVDHEGNERIGLSGEFQVGSNTFYLCTLKIMV